MNINNLEDIETVIGLKHELKLLKKGVKDARNMAYEAPELNMNNFSIEDVEKVNDAMIALFDMLNELDS